MQPTRMQKMALHGQPARTDPRNQSERGIALLGATLVLALVVGLLVWGTLVMVRQSAVSAYQVNNANQARTAALIGISALTQYAQNAYAPTASAASASGSGGGSNFFSNLFGGLLTPSTPIPTSGNGAVALNVPVGTNAATSIAFSAPYMAATVSAVVTANTFSVSPSPNGTPGQIIIMSQGASGTARATAVAVLVASSSTGSSAAQAEVPINLNGSTSFSGNVQLEGGQNASLAINGAVNASGSFSGFNNSSSTGSASYSGSTSGMNLFSNSSITITGSGQYNSIQSLGNVSISGGVDAVSIQSNGTTTLGSSSKVSNSITSIGNVTLNSSTGAGSVITQGSVTATNASVGSAQVQGNYSESSNGSVGSGSVGGSISYPTSNKTVHLTQDTGLQVPITPLTAQTVSVPQVTASTMSSLANFAFTPPPSGASSNIQATVTVNNVNGITAGTYYLYDDTKGHNDYICSSDAIIPSTFGSAGCIKIGNGYSSYNADISYSSGTWTLEGNAGSTSDIAPGVLWFQGNVTVADGNYYNSIIATGAINYSGGNSTSYAVNFANAEGENVCSNTGYTSGGILGIGATTISPSNFCTTPYTNASVGNIALLSGGDISLGASSTVYGDVIAGNVIKTSGSTTIYGYLSAESLLNNGEQNSFGGSTTVNINQINGFTPPPIPTSFSATSPQSSSSMAIVLKSLYWE